MIYWKNIMLVVIALLPSRWLHAAPVISPFAADLALSSYTASAIYLPGSATYQTVNAFNGTGYWNAGSPGTHWIQADMGAMQTLTAVKLTTAQAPSGISTHSVYLSNTEIGNDYGLLTPVISRSGSSVHGQLFELVFSAPVTGRYLQIVVNNGPTSWTALGDIDGREDWVQPTLSSGSSGGTVPLPNVLWLLIIGMLPLLKKQRV